MVLNGAIPKVINHHICLSFVQASCKVFPFFPIHFVFIGPESDHWICLSVTDSCLVNLIDLILPCEDANSKLVEVVTVVDVDDEDRVGNSLLQI